MLPVNLILIMSGLSNWFVVSIFLALHLIADQRGRVEFESATPHGSRAGIGQSRFRQVLGRRATKGVDL